MGTVYRTMWEQFIGQCGNSSSLQDNVGTAAVYKKMWEQQQNTGIRCGNSGSICELDVGTEAVGYMGINCGNSGRINVGTAAKYGN